MHNCILEQRQFQREIPIVTYLRGYDSLLEGTVHLGNDSVTVRRWRTRVTCSEYAARASTAHGPGLRWSS